MLIAHPLLPEDEFWSFIALLEGAVDDDGIERLTDALDQAGAATAVAFAERLAAVLFDLDREALVDQPVR